MVVNRVVKPGLGVAWAEKKSRIGAALRCFNREASSRVNVHSGSRSTGITKF
jgi:hypothetical protein